MSTGQRRVRVTVTLSPRVLKLVDERAHQRPDKSRSAAIEALLEQSELERQVREYYAQGEAENADDDEFWDEVQSASRALDARDAAKARKQKKS